MTIHTTETERCRNCGLSRSQAAFPCEHGASGEHEFLPPVTLEQRFVVAFPKNPPTPALLSFIESELPSQATKIREERNKEIADLLESLVFNHTTPELEKKLAFKHLRNVINALRLPSEGDSNPTSHE